MALSSLQRERRALFGTILRCLFFGFTPSDDLDV